MCCPFGHSPSLQTPHYPRIRGEEGGGRRRDHHTLPLPRFNGVMCPWSKSQCSTPCSSCFASCRLPPSCFPSLSVSFLLIRQILSPALSPSLLVRSAAQQTFWCIWHFYLITPLEDLTPTWQIQSEQFICKRILISRRDGNLLLFLETWRRTLELRCCRKEKKGYISKPVNTVQIFRRKARFKDKILNNMAHVKQQESQIKIPKSKTLF